MKGVFSMKNTHFSTLKRGGRSLEHSAQKAPFIRGLAAPKALTEGFSFGGKPSVTGFARATSLCEGRLRG